MRDRDRQTLQSILAEIFDNDTEHLASLSARDFSSRIERWLSQRFNYSLAPDMPETRRRADPVVAWLAEGTLGHCELFAGAFLLLAREAGFPTRIATGFAGGAWNAVENYFVVRNRHAHAWVEIYDVESQQWLRVDPTPEGYELSMAGMDAGFIGTDSAGSGI
ncbi:transglutaminase-like domain-containing protein, partial [Arthrospira platensis SPKY1]|nr:transglutaminase-like domain-containing protein [Arthrospira platensis SPKY1]